MFARHHVSLASFVSVLGLLATTGSAASLGHPGVSTKPKAGVSEQWQLICDPAYVTNGTFTTDYTTNATIAEVDSIFPYQVSTVTVELSGGSSAGDSYMTYDATSGVATINPGSFGDLTETGRVQVSFNIMNGQTLPSASDDDIYQLDFNQNPNSTNQTATFTDTMVNYGSTAGAPNPDFYSGFGPDPDNTPFTYTVQGIDAATGQPYVLDPSTQQPDDVTTQTQTFAIGTPEPSSIALFGAVSAAGLLRRKLRAPQPPEFGFRNFPYTSPYQPVVKLPKSSP